MSESKSVLLMETNNQDDKEIANCHQNDQSKRTVSVCGLMLKSKIK